MGGFSDSKHVTVELIRIDCLPAHVTILGRGAGSSIAIAARRAVERALKDIKLRRRRPHKFQAIFTVGEGQETP